MTDITPKKRGPSLRKGPSIGRAPPGGGTDTDEVSACRIWKEHCKKVESILHEPAEFSFNPFTTHYMCQPPTNFWPSIHVTEEELTNFKKWLDKYSMIKDMDKTPPEKYNLPQTVNQEYGWISSPLVEKNPMFNYDNNSCEITQYAAHYCSLMHTTPFSKKQPIAAVMRTLKKPLSKPVGGAKTSLVPAQAPAAAPAPVVSAPSAATPLPTAAPVTAPT